MLTRRTMLATGAALAGTAAVPLAAAADPRFVRRDGTRLTLGDRPYRFVGANIWYGAYLGAAADYGNRDRLRRELDALAALGVTNLRVLASSEQSPLKGAITPTFRDAGKEYDAVLLDGLDYLLAEMGKRGLRAVLYLGNFWEWSGGFMTYLSYVNGGRFLDMNDPAHPWPAFADMTSGFYGNARAVALYRDWVRTVVGRTNRITGAAYADDPTIMAWQLANEPRPGGGEAVAVANLPAFYRWVGDTAALIKSIDRNHLVSTGSEGLKGCVERRDIVEAEHRIAGIDYLTAHVWPLNWSWVDAGDLAGTHEAGAAKVQDYLDQHVAIATRLGKPLVVEEFGYPRDEGRYNPTATTAYKDRFYRQVYAAVLNSPAIAGSNFWAWNGEGRAAHPDYRFRPGDVSYLGDPPHEPQGWYGVFSTDQTTRAIVREHAAALAAPVQQGTPA